ncbi:type II toxin-antitoxin system HicB family antitoxin [Paenibacillus sp. GCM10012307]|uniref:Type II toxin-antitoxin system HicB family antitoxin n=1 Tax=Paenibacillus roseus TaxID=2798579 RepID=A0A934J4Y4_9BACL|nr:type II toxin-antitoxin system HicB family antitoxin [Paenibacillus roseus]
MKRNYVYPAILDFSGKHIGIIFPDLEEALSQANNEAQAIRRAHEVLKLTIDSRIADQEKLPEPTPLHAVEVSEHQRTIIVQLKMDKKITYKKKTLTIPEELNEAAEEAGINFSQVLQRAIRQELEK